MAEKPIFDFGMPPSVPPAKAPIFTFSPPSKEPSSPRPSPPRNAPLADWAPEERDAIKAKCTRAKCGLYRWRQFLDECYDDAIYGWGCHNAGDGCGVINCGPEVTAGR